MENKIHVPNHQPYIYILWFMVLITIVTGAYKPTYNWGASHSNGRPSSLVSFGFLRSQHCPKNVPGNRARMGPCNGFFMLLQSGKKTDVTLW
jgi:hypothetical protein